MITWIEALAYCQWLSTRLGYEVRLPTEWEWQQAATGGDPKNQYPWGKWEEGRANTFESEIGRVTAVGLYPHGRSAQGVPDLAGNVMEWCLNRYDSPKDVRLGGRRPAGGARRLVGRPSRGRALCLPLPQPSRQPQRQSGVSGGVCLPHSLNHCSLNH
jgi:formylglycine-generating enzyme required for sulfatase activity